jgi:hypothetical protein
LYYNCPNFFNREIESMFPKKNKNSQHWSQQIHKATYMLIQQSEKLKKEKKNLRWWKKTIVEKNEVCFLSPDFKPASKQIYIYISLKETLYFIILNIFKTIKNWK